MSSKKKTKKKSSAVSKIRVYSTTSTPSKSQRESENTTIEPDLNETIHDSIETPKSVTESSNFNEKKSETGLILSLLPHSIHPIASKPNEKNTVFKYLRDAVRLSELDFQKHLLKEESFSSLKPSQLIINLNFIDQCCDEVITNPILETAIKKSAEPTKVIHNDINVSQHPPPNSSINLSQNSLKSAKTSNKNQPKNSKNGSIQNNLPQSVSKNKIKNPHPQEKIALKPIDEHITYTSKWTPTNEDIFSVLTDTVFKKSKKNAKPPTIDPLESEISDDNPSLMSAIYSYKLVRTELLDQLLTKENKKNRFIDYLSSLKKEYNNYAKKVNFYNSDMLFDPKRSSKFLDGFTKLYAYKNSNDIESINIDLSKLDILEREKSQVLSESTNSNIDLTSSRAEIQQPNNSNDTQDNLVHKHDHDVDFEFQDLFNADSDLGSKTINENLFEGLTLLNYKDPKNAVIKSTQLLKELLNNFSKDSQIKLLKDDHYSGAGIKCKLFISWSKIKSSIKIKELVNKSEFSNLVEFKYKSENQIDDLNIEVAAVWSLPEYVVGMTAQDVEQYLKTLAVYSISPRKNTWSRLPSHLFELCENWLNQNILKTENELNSKLQSDSEALSEIIQPLIEQNRFDGLADGNQKKDYFNDVTNHVTTSYTAPSIDNILVEKSNNSTSKNTNIPNSKKNKSEMRMRWKWEHVENNRLNNAEYQSTIKPVTDDLPATKNFKSISDVFLSDEEKSRVFVIEGDTGCGKSTQIPQIILKLLLNSPSYDGGLIVCTQPRRLSAVSISKRVGLELGEPSNVEVGGKNSLVGYHIGLEPKVSDSNIILFCTTGILIQRLASNPHLEGISVIIIDEVQERTVETDFLLVVLRKMLMQRKDLKVILMSATIDTSTFSKYFDNCPIIKIPGRTFPVDSYYLEDIVAETSYVIDVESEYAINQNYNSGSYLKIGKTNNAKYDSSILLDENDMSFNTGEQFSKLSIVNDLDLTNSKSDSNGSDKYSQAYKTISLINQNKVNLELIIHLLKYILHNEEKMSTGVPSINIPDQGSILVFLPGIKDINNLASMIESDYDLDIFLPIKLHSALYTTKKPQPDNSGPGISAKNQLDPFKPAPPGKKKIVISTNIAETGITIPDVTIVIDCGRSKQMKYDSRRQISIMEEQFISRASSKQRRGRAGRVQYGVCFCLYTNSQFERFPEFDTPELTRFPLHNLCLKIKNQFPEEDLFDFFESAVNPPPKNSVENAIYSLVGAGALKVHDPTKKISQKDIADKNTSNDSNKTSFESEASVSLNMTLTPLGKQISKFPVDLHIAKMLLYGVIFGCLDPILTIAAALMQSKSVFIQTNGENQEVKAAQSIYKYGISLEHPSFGLSKSLPEGSVKPKLASFKDLSDTRSHLSDFVCVVKAYNEWRYFSSIKYSTRRDIVNFAKKRCLNLEVFESIEDTKEQYYRLLIDNQMIESLSSNYSNYRKSNNRDLKSYQPQVYGYKSGHVRFDASLKENRNSENIAIFNAALITGLEYILLPKAKPEAGPYNQSQVLFTNPVPSSMVLGNNIVLNAKNKLNAINMLNAKSSANYQPEQEAFNVDFGNIQLSSVIHPSSVNYKVFVSDNGNSTNSKLSARSNNNQSHIQAKRPVPETNLQFYSKGFCLVAQSMRKTNNISFILNSCVVPFSFILLILPYIVNIESPKYMVSSVENSAVLLKSPMRSIATISILKKQLIDIWKNSMLENSNIKQNIRKEQVNNDINVDLDLDKKKSDEEWIDMVCKVLTAEFEHSFRSE
ncbi:ATP-dependent RNA helicase DHX29 [Smittium culicis]|uniref:ATP-dependent RNA helicase DHX29 n=1 Tax=Smittium culicis TaxID=133412 RepID=A0A1R1YJW5_9FUNG|nr:ATP-dependent RNA helicase DHX29 [Smittium culicis]